MVDRNFDLPGPKWAYSEMDTLQSTTFKVPTYPHISPLLLNCISLSMVSPAVSLQFLHQGQSLLGLVGLVGDAVAVCKENGNGHQSNLGIKRSGRSEQEKYGKKTVEKP